MGKVFQPNGLSPTTTKGDTVVRSSTVDTRLPVGPNGSVLIADSTTTLGVTWTPVPVSTLGVTLVSNTFTVTTANNLVRAGGANFAITLPNAVGNGGYQVRIEKYDSGFITPISVKGATTAQTIGGQAGLTLQTIREAYGLYSDNANWQIMDHFIDQSWATYTPTPVGLGGITGINYFWRRVGNQMEVRGAHINGTVGASTATIDLPTSVYGIDIGSIGLTNASNAAGFMVGSYSSQGAASASGKMVTALGTTTMLVYCAQVQSGSNPLIPGNGSAVAGSSSAFSVEFKIPMSGWGG